MLQELEANRTLRTFRPVSDARVRLVCVPYAGGAASLFHAWSRALPAHVELRAVQLPARQDRHHEPAMTRVKLIVDFLSNALGALRPVPTAIFGHSFGAVVAFELAHRLAAEGKAPFCLIASACRAPHLPRTRPRLHELSDADFLAGMGRYFETPGRILDDRELMDLALPALRADFEALETYTANPQPLDVPIVVLRGRKDKSMPVDSALAWGEVATREFSLYDVDAGHFFIDTHREWVIERVKEALRTGRSILRARAGLMPRLEG